MFSLRQIILYVLSFSVTLTLLGGITMLIDSHFKVSIWESNYKFILLSILVIFPVTINYYLIVRKITSETKEFTYVSSFAFIIPILSILDNKKGFFYISLTIGSLMVLYIEYFYYIFLKKFYGKYDSVIGCVLIYIITGFAFGHLFYFLPNSVNKPVDKWDFVYFSFVSLATTGYGDLSPQGVGKIVVVIENLIGWILTGFFFAGAVNLPEKKELMDRKRNTDEII